MATGTRKRYHAKGDGSLILRGKTYQARWMVNGKVYCRSTKTGSRREAESKLREFTDAFRTRDEKNILINLAARAQSLEAQIEREREARPAMTLLAGWAEYLKSPNRPDSGPVTMERYESQYWKFVKWMRAKYPDTTEMRKVTQTIAGEFASHLAANYSPNTYNKHIGLLRLVWRIMAKHPETRITENPWADIRRKLDIPHTRRELTVDELRRVCEPLTGEMRLLFAVGIYTGMRLGDCAMLDWGSIDICRGLISVVPRKTARHTRGRQVMIPLHATLAGMLIETPPDSRCGFVMPETAKLYQRDAALLSKRIQRTFAGAGIKTVADKDNPDERSRVDVGFHSLRHTYVSLCANAGVPLALVQSIVGHTSPAMTMHYFHESPDALKSALVALPDITQTNSRPGEDGAAAGLISRFCALVDAMDNDERKTAMDYLKSKVADHAAEVAPLM